MKNLILIVLTTLTLSCCSTNSPKDPTFSLPPETQTGANTFGFIINGQVFHPRDGVGNFGGSPPDKAIVFWGDHTLNQNLYNEIDCGNYKDGRPVGRIIIHLQALDQKGIGEYIWKETNFRNSIDGLMQNYIYCKVFDSATNTFKYYGSYENSGKLTVTKYDFNSRIVSGIFNGKLRLKDGIQEIEIQNGRFDINWSTLDQTSFP